MNISTGLRELADLIEEHQGLAELVSVSLHGLDRPALRAFARGGGTVEKHGYGDSYWLVRHFADDLRVSAFADSREQICRKKVVGVKHVPEEIVPAHDEEIIEWECEPVLGEVAA